MKVHLDTDLGGDTDDLCALALLLKWPGIEITGVTTNTENDGKRAGYTHYAMKLAGRADIPVKSGADVSLGTYRGMPGLPQENDFWPEPVQPFPNPLGEALELLKASVEKGATVVGVGAFTNFRLLDQQYPGILRQARLVLMGGYVFPVRPGYPQWGNKMDWNIQADIHSARHVLENSSPTLVPLSVTVETSIRRAQLPALRKASKLGELLAWQAEAINQENHNEENLGKTFPNLPDDFLNFQHDSLACAVALGWMDGVEIETVPLHFEIVDDYLVETIDRAGKPTRVVTRVDGHRFNQFWLDTVTRS